MKLNLLGGEYHCVRSAAQFLLVYILLIIFAKVVIGHGDECPVARASA